MEKPGEAYTDRIAALSQGRRWAPFAVLKQDALDLAIRLLEVGPSDIVADLSCDLGAFASRLEELRPGSRTVSAFELAGRDYPGPEATAPPALTPLAIEALESSLPRGLARAFGTFVDRDEGDGGLEDPWADNGSAPATPRGKQGIRWGRLAGAAVAKRIASAGRAVVAVHAGDLDSSALANARRALVSSGAVERVVLLPLDAFVGRSLTSALLVLSDGNESVRITDLREEGGRSKGRRRRPGASRQGDAIRDDAVIDCGELAGGACRLGAEALREAGSEAEAGMRVRDLADVFTGINLSRDPRPVSVDEVPTTDTPDGETPPWCRVIGPSDLFEGVVVDATDLPDEGKFVPYGSDLADKTLREGDIVLPRSSSTFSTSLVSSGTDEGTGLPLVASSNLIVVRPREPQERGFLAALLDSPAGVAATLRGGPIRHTGVREVDAIPIADALLDPQRREDIGNWYLGARQAVARTREQLHKLEVTLGEGLESAFRSAPRPDGQ